jgi:hypothetical protein
MLPQDLTQTLYPFLLAKEKVICDFSSGLKMERLIGMLNCFQKSLVESRFKPILIMIVKNEQLTELGTNLKFKNDLDKFCEENQFSLQVQMGSSNSEIKYNSYLVTKSEKIRISGVYHY